MSTRRSRRVIRIIWRHFLANVFSKTMLFSLVGMSLVAYAVWFRPVESPVATSNPTSSKENRVVIGNFQSDRELAKIREAVQQLRDMSASGNSGATHVVQMFDALSPRLGRFSTLRQPRLVQYDKATNDLVFDFSVSDVSIEMVALNIAFETTNAYLVIVEGRNDCVGVNSVVVENLGSIWGQLYPNGKTPPADMKEESLNTYWAATRQGKVESLVTQLCR